MPQITGLTFIEIDQQLVMRCSLATPRPALDLAALHSLLQSSGLGSWAVPGQPLGDFLERWNDAATDFEVSVARCEDASFSIEVSKDAQQAWVSVKPARGGQPLLLDDLLAALVAAGVVHGVDHGAVHRACGQDQPVKLLVASATPPQAGVDTRFELLVADTRDRAPKVDAQGHIDFHELGDIPVVRADQPLMRRHPPTSGVNGTTVRGELVPAVAGKNIPFASQLIGACIDPRDAHLLRALFNGQPVHTDTSVMVEQVLRLKNVSMASGNIDFDGTVEVADDVHPGMKVHASGDVVVKGTVEGAHITCEGSVQVAGGIIAQAVIRAAHAVSARFAQSSEIHAGTIIAIADMAVHCTLESQNSISVGSAEAHKGRLVGGSTRAMMRVLAPTLGASAGGVTKVQVGVNPQLDHRLHELDALANHQKEDEDKLAKVVKHLTQMGDPRGMLPQVQATRKQLLAHWGVTLAEKAEVESKLALTKGAIVEVLNGIDGDVDLQFGTLLRHIRKSIGPGQFSLGEDGNLFFTDLAGTASSLDTVATQ